MENTNAENTIGIIENEKNQTKNKKKTFNRVAFGILIFFLVQSMATFIITSAFAAAGLSFIGNDLGFMIGTFFSFLVSLAVFWAFLQILPDFVPVDISFKPINFVQFFKTLLTCIGLMFAANYITTFLLYIFSSLIGKEFSNNLEGLITGGGIFTMIYVVVLGPILEEIAFRGILFKKLAGYGGKAYIIFSSLLFALFHLNLNQVFYAFVLGLVFSAIMYYTGKLIYSIILHIIVNFIGGGVPLILLRYDNAVLMNIWIGFSLFVASIGFIIFILWLKKQRSYKKQKLIAQVAQSESEITYDSLDLNQNKKNALPILDLYKGDTNLKPPTLKEMLLTPSFIIFVLIFIAMAVFIYFVNIQSFL